MRFELRGFDLRTTGAARTEIVLVSAARDRIGEPQIALVPATATIDVDVTSAFRGGVRPATVVARVDLSAYLPGTALLSADETTIRPDGTIEHRATLTLVRAAGAVGRVLDERGQPIASATISLHRIVGGVPEAQPSEAATSASDGSFRARAGASGDVLLVAAASGFQPTSRLIAITVGADTKADDIELRRGGELSGTVTWAGRPFPAYVEASLDPSPGLLLQVGRHSIAWAEGRVEPASAEVQVDSDGRYRLAGLQSREYRVQIRPVWTGEPLHLHGSATNAVARVVRAPAAPVDFDLRAARIVIEVRGAGAAQKANVMLSGGTEGSMEGYPTGDDGRVMALVEAGAHFNVSISPWNSELDGDNREFNAPGVGEERVEKIDLQPKVEEGSLIVVTLKAAGSAPTRAAFGFLSTDSASDDFVMFIDAIADAGGRFRVRAHEAGPHRLLVRAGGTSSGGEGMYAQAEVTVDVPSRGEATAVVEVAIGGRLRITAHDADGKIVVGDCVVTAKDGAVAAREFMVVGSRRNYGSLVPGLSSLVDPPLPPGDYTVKVTPEGWKPRSVPAKVEAGRTTDIDILLERD